MWKMEKFLSKFTAGFKRAGKISSNEFCCCIDTVFLKDADVSLGVRGNGWKRCDWNVEEIQIFDKIVFLI